MQIEYSKKFIKEFKKCPFNIKTSFKKRLEVFINDQCSPILNNHPLIGELKNCRSINITGDWRAVFEEINDGQIIYFIAIGTHSQLYSL
ncbi:MAG: type II toxin-antitoxin system mRNA interferase toxin, RelE/StbE family [Planctomycetes bacterium]|jgi:addiction module RelE/StbE family toxin|nr:type II toxin-antitoxin system mRNA interferase toxin, RelE/StbE family [Planctomycetota bacterium]